jgi:capsular exopolysaccharide synthesis family protein
MLGNKSLESSNGKAAGRNGQAASQAPAWENTYEEEEELSLRDVLGVVFKNKWWILSCFALVLVATAVYTGLVAPEYQSASKVLVNDQSATPQLGEMLGMPQGTVAGSGVANEVEILKSRAIAGRVAQKLLDQRYVPGTRKKLSLLQTSPDTVITKRRVVERLPERVQISPVAREADLISIEATSTMPKEAALVASLYAEEYVKYDRETSSRRARESRRFLENAVDSFQVNLQKQEDRLQTFFNEQQVVAPDAEAEQLIEQLSKLRQQRTEAEMRRGQAQMRLQRVQARLDSIQPGLAESITNNDQMRFQALQKRITTLQTRLEGKYAANPDLREDPSEKVEQTQQKIAGLKKQVRERANSLSRDALSGAGVGVGGEKGGKLARVQGLSEEALENKLDLKAAEASVDAIDQEINALRGQLDDLPQKGIILSRLERSLSTSSSVYKDLQKRLYDARIAERSELGDVRVIASALVPQEPVRPNVPMNLALGSLLGLILGIGGAFLRNLLDRKVRSPEDLRDQGENVLGTVPDMRPIVESDFGGREYVDAEGRKYSTRLISLLSPLSAVSEGYRELRTNLRFSRPDSDSQTIMVTSAGPGEGKTVTASNLAVTMAQSGRRTLYLDADMRRASGHKMFGMTREPGLADVLFGPHAGEGVASRFATDIENLYLMPAGQSVPNPSEVVGSEKMRSLMDQLCHEFDTVIIDTPPMLAVTDPVLMAEHCDAVLTVYSANQTDQEAVARTTEALKRVGVRPVGSVLNRFDPKSAYGSYGYGYGYGYGYEEYGESAPAGAGRRSPEIVET